MSSSSIPTRSEKQDAAVTEFLHQLEQGRGVSPNTVRNYRQGLLEFKATVPDKSWWELKPADFKAYLYKLARAQQLGPSTVRLRFAALRTFYKLAVREGKVKLNPVSDLSLPKLPRRLPVFLNQEQIGELLDTPRQMWAKEEKRQASGVARRIGVARRTGRCCATSRGWSFFIAPGCGFPSLCKSGASISICIRAPCA